MIKFIILSLVMVGYLWAADGYDSESEADWSYQPKIREGRAQRTTNPEPAVLFCRGYHFFEDKFSADDRVKNLSSEGITAIFASACYEHLKLDYTEAKISNLKDRTHRLSGVIKTEIREKALEFVSRRYRQEMHKLKQGKSVTFDGHIFDNTYVALHYLYVKSYTRFVEELKKRPEEREEILRDFSATANMIVSVAEKPEHAIRYAYGVKIEGQVLRPHFDITGKPSNPYLGKLQLILVPYKDLENLGIFRVLEAYAKDQMPVNCRIKHEIEADFPAGISKDYVVAQMVMRVPNFAHPWKSHHLQKYGLVESKYDDLRKKILGTQGDYTLQETIYEDLVQHLIDNHYSKSPRDTNLVNQALRIAADESLARGYTLKYLDFNRLPSDQVVTIEQANDLRKLAKPVGVFTEPISLDFSKGSPLKGGNAGKKNYKALFDRLKVSRKLVLNDVETRSITTLDDNLFKPFETEFKSIPLEVRYVLKEGASELNIEKKLKSLEKRNIIAGYTRITS